MFPRAVLHDADAIFTVWKYDPTIWRRRSASSPHRLLCHAGAILLFGEDKLACLAMMYRGIADGCRGSLGIRIF